MSGTHRQGPPEDCASCRKLFTVLSEHHQASPDLRLTVAEIGTRCGSSRVTAQRHLSYLVKHKRVKADGRTPVRGATVAQGGEVPDDATPLQWAVNVIAPDPTCGKGLRVLAGQGWSGRIGPGEIAAAAGISVRTWERHRPHLVTARLVQFTPTTVLARDGRHRVRLADGYRLMSGVVVAAPAGDSYAADAAGDQAKALVDSIRWYCAPPAEMTRAYRLVASRLLAQWPAEELVRRAVFPEPDGYVGNPYGLLSTRLPGPAESYVIPAEAAVRGETSARPRCRSCDVLFAGGRVSPDGLCRECREELTLPLAPVARVDAPRCRECSHQVGPAQWLCDGCGADQRVPA
ncbi:hypothetical protein OG693_39900 [Streptomyces sp. NBC_01259]|uniref:hypothetical protein n=1 Tax=Streptomyces sp. NBC_01259 TaxID=2903800 RepID=UPI00324A61AC